MTQPTHDNKVTDQWKRAKLAGSMQDCWHYANLIVPCARCQSAFEGSHQYRGLKGKISAYESLLAIIEAWDCIPLLSSLNLPTMQDLDTFGELENTVRLIHTACAELCSINNIEARTGNLL